MIDRPVRGRLRRSLAALAGAGLVTAPLVAVVPAAAQDPAPGETTAAVPRDGLLAEYLFTQSAGSTVENTADSDLGDATVVNGTDALWTGDSLVLPGGAKTSPTAAWVRLPDDVLAGETSATVTTEVKIDASMKNSWNFLWNIGNDGTEQYYFTSVRDTPRTAITTRSNGGEVNARATTALDADRWYSLTSVIDGEAGTLTFYVDGVEVASTSTTLTPASVTDQSLNAIGRAPWPDPMFKGEVAAFRVYDTALSADEVAAVSDADAMLHGVSFAEAAGEIADAVAPVTVSDTVTVLPDYGGAVTWTAQGGGLAVADDGRTLTAAQPAPGEEAAETTLTATATVRGATASAEVPVTVLPAAAPDDDYGYLMVHFIEAPGGYAEKIHLSISRGNDPEQWDILNGGEPVLGSHLGTTGVRDPFLTYNPQNGTYYIIATDLRVFGGDTGSGSCTSWCHWSSQGSTRLNVWESQDLVTWSDVRQIDLAVDRDGDAVPSMGMAWAPEATWVDDYYGPGEGAFVLYWSSNLYAEDDPDHTRSSYSRVLWAASPDFTQETYEYGGVLIDDGGNTIDTSVVQHEGTTYRITKDNSAGRGVAREAATAERWWESDTEWTTLQTRIGAGWAGGDAGGVEGPAAFKRHGEDLWYLYVDVIPTVGYRPMVTTDLDAGWQTLTSPNFSMAPSTKHGGIIGLTKAQYDAIRAADAVAVAAPDAGEVELGHGASEENLRSALPASTEVTLAHGRGTAELPVDWDLSGVDLTAAGQYEVSGTVRSLGANLNQWVGAGGSTDWDAEDREPHSSTALTVTATVVVEPAALDLDVRVGARCVVGRTVQVVTVTNGEQAPVSVTVSTPRGQRALRSLAAGRGAPAALTTRLVEVPAGVATVTATADLDGEPVTVTREVDYPATSCA